MSQKINKLLAAVVLAISSLTGCGSLLPTSEDGKTPAQRFSLALTAQDIPVSISVPVRVEDFDAPAELMLDRIVVRRGTQEVLYAKGARWTDKPTRLMRTLVSEYLKATSSSVVATPTQIDVPIVYRLSGRLAAFQVTIDGAPTASVRFDALLNNTRNRSPVAKSFSSQSGATSDSPAAMAAAINSASNQVAADVAMWVAQVAQDK
jgi:cholesterol transport system auxiliary component